jgi:membrane associated rhomboid family serine protease
VLGAYALLYPRARVVTVIFIIIFFTIVELPALIVLGLWILLQVLYGAADLAQPVGGGGVAYFAHIGGFLFGLLTIKLFADNVHEDYQRSSRLPVY